MGFSKPNESYYPEDAQEAEHTIAGLNPTEHLFPNTNDSRNRSDTEAPSHSFRVGLGGRNCLHRRNCLLDWIQKFRLW